MNSPDSNKLPTPKYKFNEQIDEVYEPREDSFLLLDTLEDDLSLIRSTLQPSLALEIGPGSGIIITALSSALKIVGLAIDINPNACSVTLKTASLNSANVEVLQGDLTSCLRGANLVDLLVFNPPYVPSESDPEILPVIDKAWAGSTRGRSTVDRLIPYLSSIMSLTKCMGYIVAEHRNSPEEMMEQLKLLGFDVKKVSERKIIGEKLCVIRFSKGINFI